MPKVWTVISTWNADLWFDKSIQICALRVCFDMKITKLNENCYNTVLF